VRILAPTSPSKNLAGFVISITKEKEGKPTPVGVRYTQFKTNAANRGFIGIERFSVTLQEFREFCQRNAYIVKKGRRGQNATIDRRCNVHGYHIWNMQILTNRQNASKGAGFRGDEFEPPF